VSAAKFRVRAYGTVDGKNYGPMLDLEYAGTPIGWTAKDNVSIHVACLTIEPVGPEMPNHPICGVPAIGGSPTCELKRGHDDFHAHTETDETGKTRTFHWGKGKPAKEDTEARLLRALEVLRYVADTYKSPLVKEAIKELTAEEFIP